MRVSALLAACAGLLAALLLSCSLAAKDVVQNLFGSITVLTDRPFHVGDWLVIGQREAERKHHRRKYDRAFYHPGYGPPEIGKELQDGIGFYLPELLNF